MNSSIRRATSLALACALVLGPAMGSLLAADAPARLEGLVLAADGRPAEGHAVLLVDDAGQVSARAKSDEGGLYRFAEVEPGRYGLGLELPDGSSAPVPGVDAELAPGQLARRDLVLRPATGLVELAPGQTHSGLVLWWVGLSPAAKAAVVVGALGAAWWIYEETDDGDDDDEPSASPIIP
jgi:hypothetical protein